MKFNRTKPCDHCPFRKDMSYLRKSRAEEIAMQDGEFPCHETTVENPNAPEGEMVVTDKAQVCAGFLIFREKIKHPNQMMRIAHRLGLYDYHRVMQDKQAVNSIYSSLASMVAGHGKGARK